MKTSPLPISISIVAGLALLAAAHAVAVHPAADTVSGVPHLAVSTTRAASTTPAASPPAAGTGAPDSDVPAPAGPPPMTGSGASYLIASAKLMAALQTAHIQVVIHTVAHPTTGKSQDTTGALEIAWEPEKKFRTSADGVAGKSIIVGTGDSLYVYNAKANEYLKKDNYPVEAGQELVRNQLAVLLGPGAPTWIYQGIHEVDHHKCDEISTENFNPSQTIYLDSTTHLPRRVIVSGSSPAGSGTQDTTFTKFASQGPLPDSLFEFTPPHGAKAVVPETP